jgi:prepilin peptidase CpaA
MHGFLVATLVVVGVAAISDWRTGHIPNWLTLGALAVAPFAHAARAVAGGLHGADAVFSGCFSLVGAAICAIVPVLLYRADAIGAGDIKLLLAIGALLKPLYGFEAEMYSFFAAGLFAPARLAYEGRLFAVIRSTVSVAVNPFMPKDRRKKIDPQMLTWFRFAPSIFLGTLVTAVIHWKD